MRRIESQSLWKRVDAPKMPLRKCEHRLFAVGGCPVGGCPVGGCPVGGCPVGGCPVGGCPVGGCPWVAAPWVAARDSPASGRLKERVGSLREPTLSFNLHSFRSFATSGAALSYRQSAIIAVSTKARSSQHRTFSAWSPHRLAAAERQPPLANAPSSTHNASAAEIGLLHAIVVREVSGVAAHRHATGLEHVRAIRDGKRHTRVLLDQQNRGARIMQALDDVEELLRENRERGPSRARQA